MAFARVARAGYIPYIFRSIVDYVPDKYFPYAPTKPGKELNVGFIAQYGN